MYRPAMPCVLRTVVKEPTIPGPFKKPSCACILVLIVSKGCPAGVGGWVSRLIDWKNP